MSIFHLVPHPRIPPKHRKTKPNVTKYPNKRPKKNIKHDITVEIHLNPVSPYSVHIPNPAPRYKVIPANTSILARFKKKKKNRQEIPFSEGPKVAHVISSREKFLKSGGNTSSSIDRRFQLNRPEQNG